MFNTLLNKRKVRNIIKSFDDVDFLDIEVLSNSYSKGYLIYLNKDKVYSIMSMVDGTEQSYKGNKYSLFINDIFIQNSEISNIWNKLDSFVGKKDRLITLIKSLLGNPYSSTLLTKADVIERIEEFDVFKNGRLDMISLNNLFDFYDNTFDEDYINHQLKDIGFNGVVLTIQESL